MFVDPNQINPYNEILGGPNNEFDNHLQSTWILLRSVIRKQKIKKYMEQKIQIGKKSSLEQGYVWAPYIPMTTTSVISEYTSKNTSRMRKINKIFNLGLDIKDNWLPKRSISSRYSAIQISNPYQTIFVNDVI